MAASNLALWDIAPERLRGVQHQNGRVSVYDVLCLLSGQDGIGAARMWGNLTAVHPELMSYCEQTRLRRGTGYRETPTVDAQGLVQMLMAMDGPAQLEVRLAAARVLVDLIEGDAALAAPSEVEPEGDAAPEHELAEWVVDPTRLEGVRKKNGYLALYDVMRMLTGQRLDACRKTWRRMTEVHPDLGAICPLVKFSDAGRGCNHQTPAVDAHGIIRILMAMPGSMATGFRIHAADVLVRYLAGDASLSREIRANRQAQRALAQHAPDHPARIFGEAAEHDADYDSGDEALPDEEERALKRRKLEADLQLAEAQKLREQAQARLAHLQGVAQALELGAREGFATPSYHDAAREAVNAALLPLGQMPGQTLDAADYLKLRGHTPGEIAHLATEFGKALKLAWLKITGGAPTTSAQDFGPAERDIFQYSRQEDREFLDAAYSEFAKRPLFRRWVTRRPAMAQKVRLALTGTRGY
jgi:hypothetical protein